MKKIIFLICFLAISIATFSQEEASPVEYHVCTQKVYYGKDPNQADRDQFTRKIPIHKGSEARVAEGERPFYHKPLFALKSNPFPINNLPAIIFNVDSESNTRGMVEVEFHVILSSPKFINTCAQAVAKKLNLKQVLMRPWPIKQMVVQCFRANELLAQAYTKSLTDSYHTIAIVMEFTPEKFQRFLTHFDRLSFVFKYSYTNQRVYGQSTNFDGTEAVKIALHKSLTSKQIQGEDPIFQAEKRDLAQNVSQSIARLSRIEHPDMFPFLNNMVETTLFSLFVRQRTIYLDDLTANDPIRLAASAYLKPLIHKTLKSQGLSNSQIKSVINSKGVSGGVGISYGPVSFGANAEAKSVKRLEDVTGSKWQKNTSSETYYPHSIEVSYLGKGVTKRKFSFSSRNFLAVGVSNKYIETSPIPVSFTDDKLHQVYNTQEIQETCQIYQNKVFLKCKNCLGSSKIQCLKCQGKGKVLVRAARTIKCQSCISSRNHTIKKAAARRKKKLIGWIVYWPLALKYEIYNALKSKNLKCKKCNSNFITSPGSETIPTQYRDCDHCQTTGKVRCKVCTEGKVECPEYSK